ncbi:hypothetical protein [Chondromyces apiculatus]|uniref:Uncharacterized protein n=1 Tax=Chondromyces apiculatus DSM 436 TaxID=1192034 RepID=A0A017TE59_9BACT|nr:hypothetical protein [Chondromyces apiculatus]EYF06906.1 Hypothetical protein CAP_1164 [Chondromyces apiculatus DSM 436]
MENVDEQGGTGATHLDLPPEVPVRAVEVLDKAWAAGAPPRRRRWAGRAAVGCVVLAAATGALECAPARPDPAAQVKTLLQPETVVPTRASRWSWPAASTFADVAEMAARDARPIRLFHGALKGYTGVRFEGVDLAFTRDEDGVFAFWPVVPMNQEASQLLDYGMSEGWRLHEGDVEARPSGKLTFGRRGATLDFEPVSISAASAPEPAALADWAYVATLLLAEPPVYSEEIHRDDWDEVEFRLASALKSGDHETALEIYRNHEPVGRCSMDERPAEVARDYAELCHGLGKLGCFLQLHLRIMGNNFARVAYSNYGEAAADTGAELLLDAGIDVDRFFRGLVVRFEGVPAVGDLGVRRLARSIKESGRAVTLTASLTQMAENPHLDDYNRLRAIQVLALLDKHGALRQDALPRVARTWLDHQGR